MRKVAIVLLIAILFTRFIYMDVKAEFSIGAMTHTTRQVDGITHGTITGVLENEEGVESHQIINYLQGNPRTNSSLHVIPGDAYQKDSWGTANIQEIITSVNNRYDQYQVIGGVNGDYYNMVVGIPVESYVRNFEVLSSGLGYGRPVIGFKDNGEVVIGRPCFEGMELLIYNEDDELRNKVPIERVNNLPFSELGTTVFFKDYEQVIPSDLTKLMINTTEFKTDGYKTRYFGSGNYLSQTQSEINVPIDSFVIVSENKYVKDLIEEGDYVVAQQKMSCEFEGVRFVIGTWEHLVEDGVATNNLSTGTYPQYRNPRTAFGLKADGTVIMLTVDGRQSESGMDGVSLYELGDIMVSLGAVTAYSLDGGGSTTMSVMNDDGEYEIVNSPSDGNLRNLSNGLFFVTGHHEAVKDPLPLPDLSDTLQSPLNIYIDDDGVLRFDKVDNAEGYLIEIDGIEYETRSRDLPLNLDEGNHDIRVKVVGDGLNFSDSPYSDIIKFSVFREDLGNFVDLFKKLAKSEIK